MKLEVFDPAMCCSTGVCGPSVDPALATFAADLDWLTSTGATVRRYNLGQEPGEFAGNAQVRELLHEQGEVALPAVFTDGELRSTGRYPTRDELVDWSTTTAPAVSVDLIAELAAIGAAIGSNCEPCFKFHYDKARKLGLSNSDLVVAVRAAQAVKDTPARNVLELAAKLLAVDTTTLGGAPAPGASGTAASEPAASGCGSPSGTPVESQDTSADATATGCCATPAPVTLSAAPTAARSCC